MKSFEKHARLGASPDLTLAALTDPEFEIGQQKLQATTQSTEVVERSRSDTRLVYEVRTNEYGRTLTGGINRDATHLTTTRVEWDLEARVGRWTYEVGGEFAGRVRVWGESRVAPDGAGSRYTFQFNAEVRIPLIGGKIEKMILTEMEKTWPRFLGVLEERIAAGAT
jgi:hypothetical protein